jgi:hypothetical protein
MVSVLMSSSRSPGEVGHAQGQLSAQLLADQLGVLRQEQDALAG